MRISVRVIAMRVEKVASKRHFENRTWLLIEFRWREKF